MRAFKQQILIYYIDTNGIPGKVSCKNMISSHGKITCYLHMWKDHRCYGYMKKKYLSEMDWYFIGVEILNRTSHGHLEKQNFSSRVEKCFTCSLRLLMKYFTTLKEKFCIYGSHVIYSDVKKRSLVVTLHSLYCILNLIGAIISTHDQCDEQTRPDLPRGGGL